MPLLEDVYFYIENIDFIESKKITAGVDEIVL